MNLEEYNAKTLLLQSYFFYLYQDVYNIYKAKIDESFVNELTSNKLSVEGLIEVYNNRNKNIFDKILELNILKEVKTDNINNNNINNN